MTSIPLKKEREKAKPKRRPPEVEIIPVVDESKAAQLRRFLCSLKSELEAGKERIFVESQSQEGSKSGDQVSGIEKRKSKRSTVKPKFEITGGRPGASREKHEQQ